MKKHYLLYNVLLSLSFWGILTFLAGSSVMAQKNVITRIKVIAGDGKSDTENLRRKNSDFSWFGEDMHRGSGDDYVFLGYKKNDQGYYWNQYNSKEYLPLPQSMITDVIVRETHKNHLGGVPHSFTQNGKRYELIEYDQVWDSDANRDGPYRGSLRGRYGVDYHKHIYISHTGSNDYRNTRVLQNMNLYCSHQNGALGGCNLNSNSSCKRYVKLGWHTHVPIFTPNEREHRVTCHGCYLDQVEYHIFIKRDSVEVRTMYPRFEANGRLSQQAADYHYKTCEICGYKLQEKHDFYNATATESEHSAVCKYCGYTKQAEHKDYGKVKMPLNDSIHSMSCGECGFIGYSAHSFGAPIRVQWQRCDEGVAAFKCVECDHIAYRKIEGKGHDFTHSGVCRRPGCIYRFPAAERDSAGIYHIRNVGNLYWFAQAVNQGDADINAVLDNDINGDLQSDPEWTPIGNSPSHAYSGTFDAKNYGITGIAIRSITNKDRTKGIFGYVGAKGTVKNLVVASVQVNGWSDLGIIAGRNDGTITGCSVNSGRVTAGMQGAYLGGICGINNGTITGCHVSQHVWLGTTAHVAGGICGNNSGSISAVTTKAIYTQEDTNPLPPIGNDNNDK